MKNQNMTAAERAAAEARIKGLRAEANALAKTLKASGTPAKADEATQLSIKEAEITEEVTQTPVEEVEVTEEVIEAPEEEVEVTEEVIEAPEEEVEVAEEVTEAPEEEVEVAEEVTETPEEEVEVTEEVTETPEEEVEVTEEVTEASEEVAEENQKETDDETVGFAKAFKWFLGIVGTAAATGIFIMLMLFYFGKDNIQLQDPGTVIDNAGVADTTPDANEVPDTNVPSDGNEPSDIETPVEPEFDIDAFTVSAQNIAKTLTTDKDIATNVDIFIEKIGADKLEELVGKYGELPVKNAIAEFLAFTPEIKMNQYISKNGLAYNPNAMNDWYNMLDEASEAYTEATGKNPEGAFMSLEGYDDFKDSREAMKALIIESGDMALLTWYEAKTTGYDAMVQQKRDTEAANAYKEEVKLELVNNVNGSIKLLELQLEQKINGTNVDTLDYTEAYEEFIINNYIYVVAN